MVGPLKRGKNLFLCFTAYSGHLYCLAYGPFHTALQPAASKISSSAHSDSLASLL